MAVKPIPDGSHTITPCLVVQDTAGLIAFLVQAFAATPTEPPATGPDGKVVHAQLQIGTSRIMLGEARSADEVMQAMLYLYVEDCDALFKRAIAAGGTAIMEPMNMFYGDRSGGLKDAWGNQWWIATHVEDVAPDELERRMQEEMKKRAAQSGSQ